MMIIQSVERGLKILETLAKLGPNASLAAICRGTDLNRSTAHHLLQTLATNGYVAQDAATRGYRLGPQLFRTASATWSAGYIAEAAVPYLHQLVQKTGESAGLAFRKGKLAVMAKTVDGKGTLRVVDKVGSTRPVHCSAIGKVFLAWLPDAEREVLIDQISFEAYTPRTIVDRTRFQRELASVVKLGYGVDDEEMTPGVRCIAAPVFALPGGAAAALCVSGPAARIPRRMLAELAKSLVATAHDLSTQLAPAAQDGLDEADAAGLGDPGTI